MVTERSQKEACPTKEIVSFNIWNLFFLTKFSKISSKKNFETNKVLKSAAILTDMLKKDEQTRKAVQNIKKDYERLVHDKKVKDILYSQLG